MPRKSTKNKTQQELLEEFLQLPVDKKLSKVVMLYFNKCWRGIIFKDGKFNFSAFNYVKSTIKNNFEEQELYLFYKYLLIIEPTELRIFPCLQKAKQYVTEEKRKAEQEKLKQLEVKTQLDYGDLLKCL